MAKTIQRKAKSKKKKKIKFYKLNMMISENRKKQLDSYCKENKTTRNKVLRQVLSTFLDENSKKGGDKSKIISKNQLQLFDVESFYDKGGAQLTMDM